MRIAQQKNKNTFVKYFYKFLKKVEVIVRCIKIKKILDKLNFIV